ncbi:MAG: SDR family oxidoreductase [Propionibacteriaceae bacterium]|jgi:NADP-dependent 3-hydroxy acid dehydrogenase YdfG|nr:SDR family oxidoreductase [Propionibacteriaceae bacterium]
MNHRRAVVTGASSGIGAATAKKLADEGYVVFCVARRTERIDELAQEIGGQAITCDITDADDVARMAATVGDSLDLLVNNAGGALGQDPLENTDLAQWEAMYESNVLGAARVTQALLPALRQGKGTIVFVTSTAAEAPYEGGGGYCGVKSAERAMATSLRLELNGEPIRVCEIAPGMVHTEEFSLVRFGGDQAKADAVYAGVPDPLVADDIADAIRWIATRPAHVMIERLVIRPNAQAANHKVFRIAQ